MPKISQNQYINTSNKDIYKKMRKNVQGPTRLILDLKLEFIRWPVFRIGDS